MWSTQIECLFEQATIYVINNAEVNFFEIPPNPTTTTPPPPPILEFQDEDMVFGDMNGVLDPKKDRFRNSTRGKLLKNVFQYLEMLKLQDTLRIKHPKGRDFIYFFPDRFQKYSRIDMCGCQKCVTINVDKANIQPKIFANNNPIEVV